VYSLIPFSDGSRTTDMVFVAANLFVYYVRETPTRVSPDISWSRAYVQTVKNSTWTQVSRWEPRKGPDAAIGLPPESTGRRLLR